MPSYRVKWEIDIEADTPEEAAFEALEIQRDPESIATVFDVYLDKVCVAHVDLQKEIDEAEALEHGYCMPRNCS